MTAMIARLPLMAGGAAMVSVGRGGHWVVGQIVDQFKRAPAASSSVVALSVLSLLAASNALYSQTMRHPAPMFAPAIAVAGTAVPSLSGTPEIQPVSRPVKLVPSALPATADAVPADPNAPVGNADVFAVQKKLHDMGLFTGTVDGYYGPMTAKAIRAFETALGYKPQGALNPEIMAAIIAAPMRLPTVTEVPIVVPQPTEQLITASITPPSQPMPALLTVAPQPQVQAEAPAPVLLTPSPAPTTLAVLPMPTPVAAPVAAPVTDGFERVAEGAESTLDAIAGALVDLNASRSGLSGTTQVAMALTPPGTLTDDGAGQGPALQPAADVALVSKVQRGLSSLGFLHGTVDGVAGEATAKAIRNFEVYYNYQVTGEITSGLLGMLLENGATL
ncbi:MAG: hypothetical protein JWR75_1985 [Devosia sp.]|nr:hypothetical protein [Devosia sp.]